MTSIRGTSIRRGKPDDAQACHEIMWTSVTDLGRRNGTPLEGSAAEWWASGESLQRFLAAHAAEWWVAVEPDGGALIGYARSIQRGNLLELVEFFVMPTRQSAGVGRALLERAFPLDRGDIRSIIATTVWVVPKSIPNRMHAVYRSGRGAAMVLFAIRRKGSGQANRAERCSAARTRSL